MPVAGPLAPGKHKYVLMPSNHVHAWRLACSLGAVYRCRCHCRCFGRFLTLKAADDILSKMVGRALANAQLFFPNTKVSFHKPHKSTVCRCASRGWGCSLAVLWVIARRLCPQIFRMSMTLAPVTKTRDEGGARGAGAGGTRSRGPRYAGACTSAPMSLHPVPCPLCLPIPCSRTSALTSIAAMCFALPPTCAHSLTTTCVAMAGPVYTAKSRDFVPAFCVLIAA